jgi:hypothetical protein
LAQASIKWTSSLQNFMNLPLRVVERELSAALNGSCTPSFEAFMESSGSKKVTRSEPPRRSADGDPLAPARYNYKDLLSYWEKYVRE